MKRQYQDAENRIDRSMHIVGDISFTGSAVIEGSLQGTVTGEMIIVAESGEIRGDLIMEQVVCCGRITGTVTAQKLTVEKTARIKGELVCDILEIESGSLLDCEIMSGRQQAGKKKVVSPAAQSRELSQEVSRKDVQELADQTAGEGEEVLAAEVSPVLPIDPSVSLDEKEVSGFFQEGGREEISSSIIEALKAPHVMIKVVGAPGSGKSTVCAKVCERLAERFEVVRLDNVIGSMKDLFLQIAEALHMTLEEGCSQMDILEKLKKHLAVQQQTARPVLLVLDNSHEMYPATLEGMMKSFCHAYLTKEERMLVVMFGNEQLNQQLDPKSISYFHAHPDCAFELRPLSKDETCSYIDFKLRRMEHDQSIDFPESSAAQVYTFSQGVIGKIDRIVEEAVALAKKKKSANVAPKFVKNIKF